MLAVEGDRCRNIDISHAIPIGQKKVIIRQIGTYALDASARHRFFAGVDKRYVPRFGIVVVDLATVTSAHVERYVGHVKTVIGEIFLDQIAFVSKADNEVVDAVMRIDLHDVPKDRPPADVHQRLGLHFRDFLETRTDPAG